MCTYLYGFSRVEALLLLASVGVAAVVTAWSGSDVGLGGVEFLALR